MLATKISSKGRVVVPKEVRAKLIIEFDSLDIA
jgi:AbrB family looped-hinge helix DNA binding protein